MIQNKKKTIKLKELDQEPENQKNKTKEIKKMQSSSIKLIRK